MRGTGDDIVLHGEGHLRVLGPPASGKTTALVERFRRLAAGSGRRPAVAVVTYTRDRHEAISSALLPDGSARLGRLPVFTYHELALEIAGGDHLIGEMEERVVLSRVLRRLGARLESDYRSILDAEPFQRSLLGVLRILSQMDLPGDRAHEATSPRARDILTLFFAYRDDLDARGFVTYYDVAGRAAERVARNPGCNPLAGVPFLLVDGFQDVDPGQYRLLEAIAPPAGATSVTVFGDPTGARFGDRGTSARFLLEVFPRAYQPTDLFLGPTGGNDVALGTTIDALLEAVLPGDLRGRFARRGIEVEELPLFAAGRRPVEVTLAMAEDEIAEAQAVAECVAEELARGRPPSEMAIAARDKRKYEQPISIALAERGLTCDAGRGVRHPVEELARALLALLAGRGDDRHWDAVVGSPYYRALLAEFEGVPAPRRWRKAADPAGAAGLLAIVRARSMPEDSDFDMGVFCRQVILPLIDTTRDDEALPALSRLGALADAWDRYADLARRTRSTPRLDEFLATSETREESDMGAGIGLYSCRELGSRSYPVVFVVGCSDVLFPEPLVGQGYVPYDALERWVRDATGETSFELWQTRGRDAHLRDEYALLLSALTRASERLWLSGPEKHQDQFCPAPSSILTGIPPEFRLPRIERSAAPGRALVATLALGGATALSVEEREALVSIADDRTIPPRQFSIETRALSPTAIQSYTTCPRRYFYSRALGIDEEESVPLQVGSAFHEAMQILSEESRSRDELTDRIRSEELAALVERVVRDRPGLSGEDALGTAARHHLGRMIQSFLALDSSREDTYRIDQVEWKADFAYGGAKFTGRLDRVDNARAGIPVLVDYKTGEMKKLGRTIRDRILPSCKNPSERLWQVPLYGRAFCAEWGAYPGVFSYYVIQPGEDPFPVGVSIGEGEARGAAENVFGSGARKAFAPLSVEELESCLDEAAAISREMFAARVSFARTEDEARCRYCAFKQVCGRHD